jgi:hypothetical protein
MSNPREITEGDLAYWADYSPRVVRYAADDPTINPCPAIITTVNDTDVGGGIVARVAIQLDEIELVHLAKGGTLWLSTLGGLPPFQIEVSEP